MWWSRFRTGILRLTVRRYRRVLIAAAVTLITSASLLGLIGVMRGRGHQALQSDTHTVITQASEQLVRSLQSRRGTLTFLRDTLNRQPDLQADAQRALGLSAVKHTRHLLGVGLIRADHPPMWWAGPERLSRAEAAQLNRAIAQRIQLRGVWRVPSTFTTTTSTAQMLLVMLEPLRTPALSQSAVIGAFEVKPLFKDFFTSGLPQRHPVQLLDGETLLYRSAGWQPTSDASQPIVVESAVALDAARWRLQMQPGDTRVVQTLSGFTMLLIGLSLIAGLGVTSLVWILAARTWILQRAVSRRTAALRRTLERLRQMAITDDLTGLYNRRFFLDRWEWECERAKRYQRPLACLMVDVNGFKQVNDRLGHLVGDTILKQVAGELRALMRQTDLLARFGGDEFVVALPETTYAQAESVADKLRQVTIPISQGEARGVPAVTLSVGLSRILHDRDNPQAILQAADESLYAAKRRLHTAAASQIYSQ